MSDLKKRLQYLEKNEIIKKRWEKIDSQGGLSTREKLEKLVKLSQKMEERKPGVKPSGPEINEPFPPVKGPFLVKEFIYSTQSVFGRTRLLEWHQVMSEQLAVIFSDPGYRDISPANLLFFDTETTGLAGGTGTIPFLLGFGYLEGDNFIVKAFILNDLYREGEFLEAVDGFLAEKNFSATVTFNGKGFDFPLMEARYILQRRRFPLLSIPHLDFLFPARTLWKNTYESRKLSFLGDMLLGLSRDEDIDPSTIPALYFHYLRKNSYALIEKVVEHNALDILGLTALLLLSTRYLKDISLTRDEGEIFGIAYLYEKYGDLDQAHELYTLVKESGIKSDVTAGAVKRLSVIMKKKKLYQEAIGFWEILSGNSDTQATRELSMHFEHREKNFRKALEYVSQGLKAPNLTSRQQIDFEKRYLRLIAKIRNLDREENDSSPADNLP